MKQARVSQPHERSYPDPICVRAGDAVTLTGRRDIWDGHCWLWAEAEDGRAGWIPDDLVHPGLRAAAAGPATAQRDYSALELSCAAGDVLTLIEERHGWAWCRNEQGESGWVPLGSLAIGD